ncbi:TPA: hypothetical protein DCL30_00640 [Candidatus Peribacteria bacterium]|nr:hypothetical protein [Candidatus Peribacteria bacterium]
MLLVCTAIVTAALIIRMAITTEMHHQKFLVPAESFPGLEEMGTVPVTGTVIGKKKVGIVRHISGGGVSIAFRMTIDVQLDGSEETISIVVASEETFRKAAIGRRVILHIPRDHPAARSTPEETINI